MRVLGLDFETTVVDPFDATKMRITEIGAILWDTATNKPLQIFSQSVWGADYVWHPLMEEITGLTEAEHKEFGSDPKETLKKLIQLISEALKEPSGNLLTETIIVAHNGKNFDKIVFEKECERHDLVAPKIHWVDSISDIPYPKKIDVRKLAYLGPAHGFLNPFSHRAIFDVLTMLKVMSNYDFEKILSRSKEPDVTVQSKISPPFGNTAEKGKKEVEEAKARGFKFDAANKIWVKRIKESEYSDEATNCPWPVVIVRQ